MAAQKSYKVLSIKIALIHAIIFSLLEKVHSTKTIDLLTENYEKVCPNCATVFIINFRNSQFSSSLLNLVSNQTHEIKSSSSSTNPLILRNYSNLNTNSTNKNNNIPQTNWRNPKKSLSLSHSTLIIIQLDIPFSPSIESILTELLTIPYLSPQAVKNADKFLFITSEAENFQKLFDSKLISGVKYKLFLDDSNNNHKNDKGFIQFCPHCLIKFKTVAVVSRNSNLELFPDNERNFHGSLLRLSTSDKVPQLLEMETDKLTGKILPKRGLYASVLKHMVSGLNFTAELLISSGGGSTGHQLANGTWAGIIGDIANGRAEVGFMAAVTVTRYQVADICAPINYAFIGFVTGTLKLKKFIILSVILKNAIPAMLNFLSLQC
jgi:hypothetical protein